MQRHCFPKSLTKACDCDKVDLKQYALKDLKGRITFPDTRQLAMKHFFRIESRVFSREHPKAG